jgi:hypothetical protein
MIFRDSQLAARRDSESETILLPLPMHHMRRPPSRRWMAKKPVRIAT